MRVVIYSNAGSSHALRNELEHVTCGRGGERPLLRGKHMLLSRSEVSLAMIPRQCTEVQTSPLERPRDPPWLAEIAILSQHLATKGRAFGLHTPDPPGARPLWPRISPLIFSCCSSQFSFPEGWTKDSIGGIFDRQGRRNTRLCCRCNPPGRSAFGHYLAMRHFLLHVAASMLSAR